MQSTREVVSTLLLAAGAGLLVLGLLGFSPGHGTVTIQYGENEKRTAAWGVVLLVAGAAFRPPRK